MHWLANVPQPPPVECHGLPLFPAWLAVVLSRGARPANGPVPRHSAGRAIANSPVTRPYHGVGPVALVARGGGGAMR